MVSEACVLSYAVALHLVFAKSFLKFLIAQVIVLLTCGLVWFNVKENTKWHVLGVRKTISWLGKKFLDDFFPGFMSPGKTGRS